MTKKNQRKERRKYVRTNTKNTHSIVTLEKRKYIRLGYHDDFDFFVCTHNVLKGRAASLDISQSGILFLSEIAPKINTLISMKPNQQILKECLKIEKLLHEANGEILGKVVRVEKNESGKGYNVAVAFLRKNLFSIS